MPTTSRQKRIASYQVQGTCTFCFYEARARSCYCYRRAGRSESCGFPYSASSGRQPGIFDCSPEVPTLVLPADVREYIALRRYFCQLLVSDRPPYLATDTPSAQVFASSIRQGNPAVIRRQTSPKATPDNTIRNSVSSVGSRTPDDLVDQTCFLVRVSHDTATTLDFAFPHAPTNMCKLCFCTIFKPS